ncbi:MAG: alpha-glucosidase [Spirochaetia bacterium]|nr:alpha-glucosidase [Spirochaetia bacterium]
MSQVNYLWWKHGVLYHLYVRSFYDSNDDGIGDLQGVIEKLDYIKDLGFSGIWLSPVFKSPMFDFGYDISDYYSIDSQYGTMDNFKQLLNESRRRGLYIILDIAVNHTSQLHPWFIESSSSANNLKRNWYIWKKGKWIGPPNNWITGFFQSAWKYDCVTKEYYLHSFLKNQPDLNWRNVEVQDEFVKIFKFWMDLGVSGFRLDMVNWLIKDKEFRDNPSRFFFKIFQKQIYNKNNNKIFPILKMIRKLFDQYPESVTIGEVFTMPPGDPELSAFYMGNGQDSLHMAFDFSMMYRFWNARLIFKTVSRWIHAVGENGWPVHVLSNHDQKRSFSRFCRGKHKFQKAKVLATLFLTLPGTPIVYYGEELGMKSIGLKKKDIVDPLGLKFWPLYNGRDSSRTPMKWNSQKNAGFSNSEKTWLPVDADYETSNVMIQKKNPDSLLNYYKELISLRNKNQALHRGKWKVHIDGKEGIIAYFRTYINESILVVLNLKNKSSKIKSSPEGALKVLFSTHLEKSTILPDQDFILMRPMEATIYSCLTSQYQTQ